MAESVMCTDAIPENKKHKYKNGSVKSMNRKRFKITQGGRRTVWELIN